MSKCPDNDRFHNAFLEGAKCKGHFLKCQLSSAVRRWQRTHTLWLRVQCYVQGIIITYLFATLALPLRYLCAGCCWNKLLMLLLKISSPLHLTLYTLHSTLSLSYIYPLPVGWVVFSWFYKISRAPRVGAIYPRVGDFQNFFAHLLANVHFLLYLCTANHTKTAKTLHCDFVISGVSFSLSFD